MRELRLPKAATIRLSVAKSSAKPQAGGLGLAADTSTIEKNGHEIILAAIMLEDRMIEATSKIMFGSGGELRREREFFAEEIMGTSYFSYAFKRRAFTRLLELFSILEESELKQLKAGLNKVMEWRNAFAHGTVITELHGGNVLRYYSGGWQELSLNDAFFELVESTIRSCLYVCNGII